MTATLETTVREIALERAGATRVFEKLGIDYCCGGNQPLERACHAANLDIDQVLKSLEAAEAAAHPSDSDRDWQAGSLGELIAHIKNTHHKYTREEISRLETLFEKVCSKHGENHPELRRMQLIFQSLAQELTVHMMKEEMVLFPYIVRMEEAVIQEEPVMPAPFGTVQNPVTMMEHEHDSAGEALRQMREASSGYAAPPDLA